MHFLVDSVVDWSILCCFRYKNRPKMGFDDTSLTADQEFELQRDPNGDVEYGVK